MFYSIFIGFKCHAHYKHLGITIPSTCYMVQMYLLDSILLPKLSNDCYSLSLEPTRVDETIKPCEPV